MRTKTVYSYQLRYIFQARNRLKFFCSRSPFTLFAEIKYRVWKN